MKRKILIILFMILLALPFKASAEEIDGLHENLSKLFLDKNFMQKQINEMYNVWLKDFNKYFWGGWLEQTKAAGKTKTDSDEEEYQYWLDQNKPDYSAGVFITPLTTRMYANQYAVNGKFNYLFSNSGYWGIVSNNGAGINSYLTTDGTFIEDSSAYGIKFMVFTKEMCDFIRNENNIRNILSKRRITKINYIKISSMSNYMTFLYINCSDDEYIIPLYVEKKANGYKIKENQIYSVAEAMQFIVNKATYNTKPNYDMEAQSLQADGLLQGNENGLDLLKPLTRIEAIAILVRVIGLEDEQTSDISYFADIPSDNWSAKYANIAKDKGIAAGVGDDMFAPNDIITASQFAAFILRNMGKKADWQTAINTFIERGLITSEQADKMDLFTRGDMAKIIYESLQSGIL